MTENNTVYTKFRDKMSELFQMDRADLDFGMYRIMNAKRGEINDYLENELYPQVSEILQKYAGRDKQEKQKELNDAIKQAEDLGVDPNTSQKVQDLKQELAEAVDTEELERKVFSHLFTFFSRYYDKGDFISKRRYKDGAYMIPYEGEEVKLVWANMDQYYIKTSEYLRDYTFYVDSEKSKRVHFKLIEAEENKDNTKSTNGNRRFDLADEEAVTVQENELHINFIYKDVPKSGKENKQDAINKKVEETILENAGDFRPFLEQRANEKSDRSILGKHLNDYTARNTYDYFIHKNLGGFLRKELDFYIKNEIMRIDDIDKEESIIRVESYLDIVRAVKKVGEKIISFLAHLEEFQKKLWLKKKIVVESGYCVTLDRVPEELWDEIAANKEQEKEWIKLGFIDKGKHVSKKWLKENPFAVIDTKFYGEEFKDKLLSSFDNLDESTDGLIINSENFQALNLLQERYREKVKCIYIDPPYNTGDSKIIYKNEYDNSAWLSLMNNRISLSQIFLSVDFVYFIAIDDYEMSLLSTMIDTFSDKYRREMIVINHHPQGGKATTLANTHEYMVTMVNRNNDRVLVGRKTDEEIEYRPYKRSGTAQSNFRKWRPNSFFAILVNPNTYEVMGLEKPPQPDTKYPKSNTSEGYTRVYPLGVNSERVWRNSYDTAKKLIEKNKIISSKNFTIYQIIEHGEKKTALFSNWIDSKYNAGTNGANLLRDIIGPSNIFSYPKSIYTLEDAIYTFQDDKNEFVLDYFAGSGTTAHAVINLNREDGGKRKYILVEMGQYFDTVLKPRIQKVVYADTWKDGKPVRKEQPDLGEEGNTGGSSHMFKYMKLESYEDTLNNLEVLPEGEYTKLKEKGLEGFNFREGFMLNYFLDHDTGGAKLSTDIFSNPFDYKLQIATGTVGETKPVTVDLIETFSYLIGLTVEHRWKAKGCVFIEGFDSEVNNVLVVWRNSEEVSNKALSEIFKKQEIKTRDREFDLIYVNGDNNLENIRLDEEKWKVRLIEHEFMSRMFTDAE